MSATAEATTLNDVKKVSELEELGWTVDGKDKAWTAHEKAGDLRTVGPANSVAALYTQVMLAVGKPPAGDRKQVTGDEHENGDNPSSRLPGMEEPAIEALDQQADVVRDAKIQLDKARARHADAADAMKELLKEHGRKRCRHGGWNHTVEENAKLVSKPETKEKKKGKNADLKAAA